jgi:hypothetical protein
MPLDPQFVADCPYAPDALLLDDVLRVDAEKSEVLVRMPTHEGLPLTRDQRTHPLLHPRHVSGGLMVHMTGMVGFVHAYHLFGLRHREGWIGYGVRIHGARFHKLASIGPPLHLRGWTTHVRKSSDRILARYGFEFTQGDNLIYEGDQTALWTRIAGAAPG